MCDAASERETGFAFLNIFLLVYEGSRKTRTVDICSKAHPYTRWPRRREKIAAMIVSDKKMKDISFCVGLNFIVSYLYCIKIGILYIKLGCCVYTTMMVDVVRSICESES